MTTTVSQKPTAYAGQDELMPLARWERELIKMCRDLRESENKVTIIIRWDGLTWAFQECLPPRHVPER